MPKTLIDPSHVLLILIGFPVGRSLQILTERFLIEPYPRRAWGSWLFVGWAIALFITILQFVLGTILYSDRLAKSFLFYVMPTIAYAFILLALISTMFPKSPSDVQSAFLLTQFQHRYRSVYAFAFGLAVLPFIMGFTAFQDPPISVQQISRVVWMGCFLTGIFISPLRLAVHKTLWFIAFPLLLFFFLWFARDSHIPAPVSGICSGEVVERLKARGFTNEAISEVCKE